MSPPTNKQIREWGVTTCVDGACLGVKCYIGHCLALVRQGVRLLFVPQIVSVSSKEYTCPYFLGLPDLLRQYLPESIELLTPVLDARKGEEALTAGYLRFGLSYASRSVVRGALHRSMRAQRTVEEESYRNLASKKGLNVLILGPRYIIDDPFLSGNLRRHLENLGTGVCTAAQVPELLATKSSSKSHKRLFWSGARHSMDALEHFAPQLDGVVNLSPFGCGAESMVGVLIEQHVRGEQIAVLDLTVDEHTSEVGLITRLEAFCDLLERKKRA